ncbi:MAG: hydrogenase maturation nickel metallochaperone HypA [Propionibacteriaceae bacterium]|jgi:hydrogenase nickel incorporation protein HypA/HybF|nr:hydrogenase maturation nickel metallochaperone HypA [Propionibacteriaceae bacterium]
MHELALSRSIASIVARAAEGRRVAVVELAVGDLRQVVPSTLERCWALLCAGTALEASRLAIRRCPGVIRCDDCGATTRLAELPILRCEACQSTTVHIVSGEEFLVTALQLED